MSADDISTMSIAAGAAGTVTAGALVMLLLQNVKSLTGDWLQGPRAEAAGGVASLVALLLAFILADASWEEPTVYAQLFIGWMALWVASRSTYAMLFKVSVAGSPPAADTEVPASAVTEAEREPAPHLVLPGQGMR